MCAPFTNMIPGQCRWKKQLDSTLFKVLHLKSSLFLNVAAVIMPWTCLLCAATNTKSVSAFIQSWKVLCTNTQTTKQYLKLVKLADVCLLLLHPAVCWWTSYWKLLAERHLHLSHSFFNSFLSHLSPVPDAQRYKPFLHDRWQVNNHVHQRQTLKLHAHRTSSTSLSSSPFVPTTTQKSRWVP